MIKRPQMYQIKYNYTLNEILSFITGDEFTTFKIPNLGNTLDYIEIELFERTIYPQDFTTKYKDSKYFGIWVMIVNRFGSEIMLSLDKEFDEDGYYAEDEILQWIKKLINIFDMTEGKYLKMLSLYTTEMDNILRKLSNEVSMKYNDTPQDEGNFVGDAYMTTFTKTTTEVDNDTPMARLREVQDNYKNLLHEWSNEFSCLFMEDYNL